MQRNKLPFRITCEGYFIDSNANILALNNNEHIIFPGGGVNENETPEQGVIRETLEETGAIVDNVNKLKILNVVYGPKWRKTEKQKKRYEQFQGDEIHFFKGTIKNFDDKIIKGEDYWKGDKLILIQDVINIIEDNEPFSKDEEEYREVQLKLLKGMIKNL